jgi:hypothetical protein
MTVPPTDDSAPVPPAPQGGETTFASLALADDMASLDPEHPVNARIRDAGAGLVPRVLSSDAALKRATVGAGAIVSVFSVPFGWHVFDDGRRTLVYDAGNRVQVNLTQIDPEGASDADVLETLLAQARRTWPDLQHLTLVLGGMKCLALHGISDGETALEQAYLVREVPGGRFLLTRVTALPPDMSRAMDLAELVLTSMQTM